MAEDPSELIGTLAEAYVESRCLHVVAALGVADEVDDEPRPIGDIAGAVGADPGALFRIMRHLAATGVFAMVDGTFVHNEASRLLRSDDPSDLLGLVRMMGMPVIWDSFAELEHSARTGRPATEARHPEGFFGYLADHPAESRPYDEGMTAMTVRRLPRILPGYDFSGCAVIADVGGGRGHLLRAVLERTPSAQGILFDQASVVSGALAHDRMTVQAGSFFVDPLPQADCYLLSNIIHDWGDPEALTILRGIRAAAAPDSRMLLFEFVVPDDAAGFDATDIDVCMLALVSGRERTQDEYARLLAEAGFELARVIPTESQSILEARPV